MNETAQHTRKKQQNEMNCIEISSGFENCKKKKNEKNIG